MIRSNLALKTVFFVAFIVSGLTACGGGGGGSSGDGGNGGFTASTPNTKPQASSAESTSSSAPSSSASSKSSSSQAINKPSVVIDTTAPSAPSNFSAQTSLQDRVILSWSPSTDNVNVEFYKIYRNQVQIDTIFASQNTYVDYDIAIDRTYTYSISAGDNSNNWSEPLALAVTTPKPAVTSSSKSSSASSSRSSVAPIDKTSPIAPEHLLKINAFSGQIDIAWTPAIDNVAVTSYRIYRNGILMSTQNTELMAYSDKTVSPGIEYWYGVSAGDAAGNWSEQKLLSITTPAPVAQGNITLKWLPPTERENGTGLSAEDISGYKIRYKTLNETTYNYASIAKNQNQANLTNLTGDYYFEIAVFDTAGLYSNYVNITPQ